MKVLKAFGWAFGGLTVVIVLVVLVLIGSAWGTYWYFSRNPDIRGTLTFPSGDHEIVVELFTDRELTKEEIERTLEEGTFQGQLQLFGPFNFKLIGLRMGATIPIEDIVETITEQVAEEIR